MANHFLIVIFFLKKLKILLSKDALNWSKAAKRHLYRFKWMLFFWTFYSSNKTEKKYPISTKIWSNITVFNIKNKKNCFLSSKSVFLKDHVTLE